MSARLLIIPLIVPFTGLEKRENYKIQQSFRTTTWRLLLKPCYPKKGLWSFIVSVLQNVSFSDFF